MIVTILVGILSILILIGDYKLIKKSKDSLFGENKGIINKLQMLIVLFGTLAAIYSYFHNVYPVFNKEEEFKILTENVKQLHLDISLLEEEKSRVILEKEEKTKKLNEKITSYETQNENLKNDNKSLKQIRDEIIKDNQKLIDSYHRLETDLRYAYGDIIFGKLLQQYYFRYYDKSDLDFNNFALDYINKELSKNDNDIKVDVFQKAKQYIEQVNKEGRYINGDMLVNLFTASTK